MSTGVQFQVGGEPGTYTVEHRGGCRILRGNIPTNDFVALSDKACEESEDAVFDPGLSRHLGAAAVIGPREAIRALATETGLGIKPDGLADMALTDQIHAWLRWARTGASSETLAQATLHFCSFPPETGHQRSDSGYGYPHDADDFSRCLTLLDWAPGTREYLDAIAALLPSWAGIIAHWNELEALGRSDDAGSDRQLNERLKALTENNTTSDSKE